MPFRLQNEDDDETENDEQEKKNALSPACVFLIPSSILQLSYGFLHVNRSLFYIILDAVKKSALVDDESGEILEEFRKSSNAISDFGKLTIPGAKVE